MFASNKTAPLRLCEKLILASKKTSNKTAPLRLCENHIFARKKQAIKLRLCVFARN
jgi:hypothetical protein